MDCGERRSTRSERWRLIYGERRFGILLTILTVLLAGPPVLLGLGLSAGWFDGLMSVLMLAAILSLCFEPQQGMCALLLGVPTICFSMGGYALPGTVSVWALFFGHVCGVLFLFGAAVLIVKSLLISRAPTFDSVAGTLCGYLFLGLGWAVLYSLIESYCPGAIEVSPSLSEVDGSARASPQVLTYYSFVTLTTVGYGDVVPASSATRTLAWIEAITGQFYLAVIVAGLAGMLAAKSSQTPSSQSPLEHASSRLERDERQ